MRVQAIAQLLLPSKMNEKRNKSAYDPTAKNKNLETYAAGAGGQVKAAPKV